MQQSDSRYLELMNEACRPPYITFEADQPVVVIPLAPPEPYQQPERDVTRYRIRVGQITEDCGLVVRLITLPETAAQYFAKAAEQGSFVSVTMQDTPGGIRYWSKALEKPLTEEEQEFVEVHKTPE